MKGSRLAALENELLYSQNRYNWAVLPWNSLLWGAIKVLFGKILLWCTALNSTAFYWPEKTYIRPDLRPFGYLFTVSTHYVPGTGRLLQSVCLLDGLLVGWFVFLQYWQLNSLSTELHPQPLENFF